MSLADTYHDDLRESLDHLGRPRNHRRPGEQPSQGPHPAASSIWLTRDGGASWTAQSIPPGAACNGDCWRCQLKLDLELAGKEDDALMFVKGSDDI
jgi:hypothetical protein